MSTNPGSVIHGDANGAGGDGRYYGGNGRDGGGNDNVLSGTGGNDVIFGDGAGGGGGGGYYNDYAGDGGKGGGGADILQGGAGADILFGDGFDGQRGSGGNGGAAGFGGAGGGGGYYGNGGAAWPGSGGQAGARGSYYINGAGGAGAAAGSFLDEGGVLWLTAESRLTSLRTAAVGAGRDTLDGGAGSDELFGGGGNDQFAVELNDAATGDVDTLWDFNAHADVDQVLLTIGGVAVDRATVEAVLASQVANGSDREIVFGDGMDHQVTIVVKGIDRDLHLQDFGMDLGFVVYGDANGAGGSGAHYGADGWAGGAGNSELSGTDGNDVIFGDGAGGGGGGGSYYDDYAGDGGKGGDGADILQGGAGADILFGDGFDGQHGSDGPGGTAGFGGAGGGGGGYYYGDGGAAWPGSGGQAGAMGSHFNAGGAGASAGSFLDEGGALWLAAESRLTSLRTAAVGAGRDTLDGGAGSDELFGGGGNDQFVVELNDAATGDVDTLWDFNAHADVDQVLLTIGGVAADRATVEAVLASQVATGSDREIVFSDGMDHQVTIVVKGIDRDLHLQDFGMDVGFVIYGDANGAGGSGAHYGADGRAGGGGNSELSGTGGNDVIFGDGAGGGGGGSGANYYNDYAGDGGKGGDGADILQGGAGADILFGDGFDGQHGSGSTGGTAGFGGAGGGGGGYHDGDGGAAWPGSGGQAGARGSHSNAGGTGAVAGSFLDEGGALWLTAESRLTSLRTAAVGAGRDTLDGGADSDELFGGGGNDQFVVELNDAATGDVDTLWDFNAHADVDQLLLTIGGAAADRATVEAVLASQVATGSDREFVFSDGMDHQVTIVVKGIDRDLHLQDFGMDLGFVVYGDANGAGGNGGYYGADGRAGGGGNSELSGTGGNDVIFGDGAGGGGGGGYYAGDGGKGGGGVDRLLGGAGADILFGDGFDGQRGSGGSGGAAGFGGGGGGGGGYYDGDGGAAWPGSGGQAGARGSYYNAGGAGAAVGSFLDEGGVLWLTAESRLTSLRTATVGAGRDTLDGGAGSDELFGGGGNDQFIVELNDAATGDVDTLWDFNAHADVDQLLLTIGGVAADRATVEAVLASQVANGSDREFVFGDGMDHQVTIVVKGIGRDLRLRDFGVNQAPSGADRAIAINEDTGRALTTADFGFSDLNDSPSDSLLAVEVSSLPASGRLTLNSVAVTAGQFIGVADINAGKLLYTPATNASGSGYASFTFQVQDNGGTANGGADLDPTPNRLTFNVAAVNDAPAGSDRTVTVSEDTGYILGTADFGFADTGDSPANGLLAVKVASLPGAGTLTLSGVVVTAGRLVSVADLNAGKLVYTPAANASGSAYASFTFQVQDNGGTTNGGTDLDPTANRLTFNVTGVNDAPSGSDKTITVTEDARYTLGAADFGFTDPGDSPSGGLLAVKVASLPAAGTLTLDGVAVTAGQFIGVADLNAGKLVYAPAANGNGNAYASFTFQVQDNGGTANGGTDLDPTANRLTFNVTAVNDAPAGSDKTIAVTEDTRYTLSAADFGFTDPADSPAGAFLTVNVASLPAAGTLSLGSVAVTTGQSIKLADINAGNLKYTPAANGNGTGYASFTFQVRDNGGTANSGIDLDPTPNRLTFDVTSVNDTPAGSDTAIAVNEDSAYTLSAADFGFSDADDGPSAGLLAVKVAKLSLGGTLTLDGVAVTAGQFIGVADLDAGRLVYTPAANGNGSAYASFTFQVQDGGGTANGGSDLDPTPNRLTFNLTSVNDVPAGADKTITLNEDVRYTLSTADFGFSDPADSPANAFLAVRVASLPADGTLMLGSVAVTTGQSISVADINAGKLTYIAVANTNGSGYASFAFQVQDNGGIANAGADLDPTANLLTFNVTAVNDAPAGSDRSITLGEDTPYTLSATDFGFTDPADSSADALLAVKVASRPTAGTLKLGSVAVTADQVISVADINAGKLTYTPAANASGSAYASFTFQVRDSGGTANGGTNLDPTPNRLTFDVTAVNDAPAGSDRTLTVYEDAARILGAADFGFTDPGDSPSGGLLAVKVASLPAAGTLTLDSVAVTAGQFIGVADLNAGKLVYAPAANGNGNAYASFTFQVQDNGGTANGGTDLDPTANRLTFNVTAVNDAPTGSDKTIAVTEDTRYTLSAADFGFTDPADSPAGAFLTVNVASLPAAGTLSLGGVAVTTGRSIKLADINAGNLKYTPAANGNGAGYASFTFQVRDNGGTANSGIDLDPTPNRLTFDVTSVNDAPSGTDGTIIVYKDTARTLSKSDFGFTDASDSPADSLLAVRVASLPAAGTLQFNGLAVTRGQLINATDLDAGKLVYTPAADSSASASFTFQVMDDGGTANGGTAIDPTPNRLSFAITTVNNSVNHAPNGTDKTITLNEDTARTLTTTDFGFTDPNDSPAHGLLAVEVDSLPGAGTLTLNGAALGVGQSIGVADINAGKLVYTSTADSGGVNYASFTFRVQDNGGTANSGIDLDPTPNRLTFDITTVNDAPAGSDKTVTLGANSSYTLTAADFGFADPKDSPANDLAGVKIVGVPTAGTLTLGGTAVTDGQFVSAADLSVGNLLFTSPPDAAGAGYTSFTFQVQDNGGTAHGGVDLDPTPNRITFDVAQRPGVTITPRGEAFTSEKGDEASFDIVLNTRPGSEVILTFTSTNPAEGVPTQSQLVFTPATWNVPQTLTLRGVDDAPGDVYDPDVSYQVTGKVVSDDINYVRGVAVPTFTLTNRDDPADAPLTLTGDRDPNNLRDVLRGGNVNDILSGNDDIDYLYGGRGDDRLNGGNDDDRLYGEEGADRLNGDNGFDTLDGGAGNDVLSGGNDDDTLSGGDGNDQLNGDNGYDSLDGGAGADVLNGGDQDDTLDGGDGNDKLYGNGGDDQLRGGSGNDTLDGGTGTDQMDAGVGDDVYYIDDTTDTVSDSGPATDRDTVIIPATLTYKLGASLEDATLSGSGNGGLTGNVGRNTLTGNGGANRLDGGGGDDALAGGAGNDTLLGGSGTDTADYADATKPVNANLSTGKATGQGTDLLTAIENLLGGKGGDTLVGNSAANAIVGGAGNDLINGGGGADTLTGGNGADRFVYKAVADTGLGAAGRDVIVDFSSAQGDRIDLRALDVDAGQPDTQQWSFVSGGFTGKSGQVVFASAEHLVQFDQDGDGLADFEVELTGVARLVTVDFILT